VVNDPKSFDASWQRFLVNRLRDYVPYAEVPIRLIFRPRGRREKIPQH
jgi:predicted GTPase